MPLDSNLNVSPYFDDFDEQKNFHRVLFRPGVAVQARELTQLQTILQNQIERFGDNIYRTGTIIKGCALNPDYRYNYIKILDNQADGQPVSMALYSNSLIIQESSNLRAFAVNYKTGLESQDPDLNTLYIKYQNTGTGGEKTFSASQVVKVFNRNRTIEDINVVLGGTLYSNNDTVVFSGGSGAGASAVLTTDAGGKIVDVSVQSKGSGYTTTPNVSITTSTGSGANIAALNYIAELTVAAVTNAVGIGAAVKTSEGIIYQKGNFIRVDEEEIVIEKYSNLPNNKVVGFRSAETFVNSAIDTSLLDVATGTPNYAAPGANRLKLTPQLVVMSRSEAKSNNEFLALLEFENGRVIKDRTYTQFNSLNREISRRTFEESGNYVINPMPLDTEDITPANTTHFNLVTGGGTSYVNGERIQILNYVKTPIRKADDSANVANQTINTQYGSYILVKQLLGYFEIKEGTTLNLRETAATDVSDNAGSTPTAPGNLVGTARARALEYHSGTIGTPDCVYRLYIFDIRMATGFPFNRIRSVSVGSTAVADLVLENSQAILKDVENDILVFKTGTFAVKELNSEEFIFRTSTNSTFTLSGDQTITFSGGNTVPYGTGSLTDIQINDFIVVPSATFRYSANNTGTVDMTNGEANVLGTSTTFTSTYKVGDFIQIGQSGKLDRIVTIFSDVKLAVANTTAASYTANAHYTAFPRGVPIDFNRDSRDISIPSTTSITVDIGTSINVAASFVMYHDLENFEPAVRTKTVSNPVYVKVSSSRVTATPNGPWCLGLPDVISLEGVHVGTSSTYSDTTTNYAEQFELITGQKDNFYGLAYLRKKPGSTLSLSGSNNLTVKLKVFTHSSGKYFSTESYPVDDSTDPLPSNKIRTESIPVFVSPTSGEQFPLRDSVDFRPIASNTAVYSSTVGSASIDPDATETIPAGEKFFPSPSRSFECNIEAYMSRVDRIVLGSDGNIRIIEGLPAFNPVAPPKENTSMDLGLIRIMPYPSLTSRAAMLNKRPDLKSMITPLQTRRYTMGDIRDLENRLQRLEYYTLLNTLETDAATLAIPSSACNTVEVFKNGFFVDSFDNYVISNINDGEYKALVDTTRSRLVPQEEIFSIDLKFDAVNSVNATRNGDLVTLNYTQKELLSQPLANKERTLVEGFWSFRGKMTVIPRVDNFFDREVTATSSVEINIADPINALVNAQNEINSRVATATSLINTVNQTSSAQRMEGNFLRTDFSENITETFEDEFTTITVPPVQTSITQINNLLTSVHINPYMRGQKIGLYVVGLRPGAQHYLFFDGVDLTNEAVSATLNTFSNATINDFVPRYNKGSSPGLFADDKGNLGIVVWMPADTFTTGEKEFLVVDVSTLDSEQSATSKATGKFASFTMSGEATNITIGTKSFDLSESSFDTDTFTQTRSVTTNREWTEFEFIPPRDPLAQTFLVQKQAGRSQFVMISSIDVFFKQKDSTKGVTLEIREVDEGGYPTNQVLPFSSVYKTSAEVSTSATASSATTFTFPALVTLKTGREYAITLTPDSNSPEYRVWTAIAGVPDVTNTNLITNLTWGLGTLFFSTSGRAFTAVQNEDLKFTVRYAEFNPTTGTVELTNGDMEFLTISDVSGSFVDGEDVAQLGTSYLNVNLTTNTTSYVINTSTSLTSTLAANDYVLVVYGTNKQVGTANVKAVSTTVSNAGSTSTGFTTKYAVGDYINIGTEIRLVTAVASDTSLTVDSAFNATITDSNHYSVDEKFDIFRIISANSTSITVNRPPAYVANTTAGASIQKAVHGVVNYYSPSKNTIYLSDSNSTNSTFKVAPNTATYFAYLIGDRSDAVAKVTSINNLTATGYTPLINILQLPSTTVSLSAELAKTAGGTDSASYVFGGKNTLRFNDTALIKSKSNEISGVGITKSFKATINFDTDKADISPVLDVNPISIAIQKYNINNDSTNENTRYGSASSKYISKRLELAEDQDAEDIKVFLKAYRPSGTDIEVYAKILNSGDSESFDDKDWSMLQMITSSTLYSSSVNENDLREYEFTFRRTPTTTGISGKVTTAASTTLEGFGTTFTTDFTTSDLIKIVYSNTETDFEIIPIASITDNDTLVLAFAPSASKIGPGYSIEKVTKPKEAYKNNQNGNVVRYFDSSRAAHDTYKFMAIKIVLKATGNYLVPSVDDVRAIAISV